jgi:sigma-E factor negative regulatory protein RseC
MQEPDAIENCHTDVFTHKGTISNINEDMYSITIISQSACSSCHSKSMCSVNEMQEKIIEVPRIPGETHTIGDTVEILMNKSMGIKAVILGYLLPFILLLSVLILFSNVFHNDGIAGLAAIGSVAVYYLGLYILKDKFKKTFRFTIRS